MFARVLVAIPSSEEFVYRIPEKMSLSAGCRVIVPFGSRSVTACVIAIEPEFETDYTVRDIIRVVDKDGPVFNEELVSLARFISQMYLCSPGQALSAMIPSGRRESDSSLFEYDTSFKCIETLSDEQRHALDTINSEKGIYYLYGITGSGKSEVFLRAAEHVIAQGLQVIYLVPEITLTHQLSQDVFTRFSGRVALLHSALTPSQRLKEWHRIMNHEADIVIGARSAVFAPCARLGLIIMDEEHENSYKSGQTPRYHARQVAQKRCQMNGVSLIMGSATPSLEAWNMMERGLITKLELTKRVAGGKRPRIDVVSLAGQDRCITPYLEDEMRKTLLSGHSVILFLNRRGYSYYYHCEACGHVIQCPHCSLAMTYHKKTGLLHCHYCGFSTRLDSTCPECGCKSMTVAGHGTEKVEEEVRRLFPSARIERLDADVATQDREKVRQVIHDFREGRIDILLGTQMVAKGLNFPRLSLVGVINADSTLSVPDFRSEERTYSLLEQVAGRAGRYDESGHVIIQSYRCSDRAIQAVLSNTGRQFYAQELEVRKILSYPPFRRLTSVVLRSAKQEKASTAAHELASVITSVIEASRLEKTVTVSGVCPCVIEKRASSWRWQILISADNVRASNSVLEKALELYRIPSGVHLETDVDPLSLL